MGKEVLMGIVFLILSRVLWVVWKAVCVMWKGAVWVTPDSIKQKDEYKALDRVMYEVQVSVLDCQINAKAKADSAREAWVNRHKPTTHTVN